MSLAKSIASDPVVKEHDGVFVVRDDLIPGGTKARFLVQLFEKHTEIVYASPAYGGAQLGLAYAAQLSGKRATVFVAKRKELHPRTHEAYKTGAKVFQVPHGYLSNVQSKARAYAQAKGAFYLTFGSDLPEARAVIAQTAATVESAYGPFDEIWAAAGSGTLIRALQEGIQHGKFYGVQIGREVDKPGCATIIKYPLAYEQECKTKPPFPSCPNYDAKAWEVCRHTKGNGRILFWNVIGPSPTSFSA